MSTDRQWRYRFREDRRGQVGIGWSWQWMETKSVQERNVVPNSLVPDQVPNPIGISRQGQFYYVTAGWRF